MRLNQGKVCTEGVIGECYKGRLVLSVGQRGTGSGSVGKVGCTTRSVFCPGLFCRARRPALFL